MEKKDQEQVRKLMNELLILADKLNMPLLIAGCFGKTNAFGLNGSLESHEELMHNMLIKEPSYHIVMCEAQKSYVLHLVDTKNKEKMEKERLENTKEG